MGKSYYKGKNKGKANNFAYTCQRFFFDFFGNITNNIARNNCPGPRVCNRAAQICIYILIGITLLFSGISFYGWVILGMLILILQFV